MSLKTLIEKSKDFTLSHEIIEQRKSDRISFIEKFPLDSLKDMTIDQYVAGTDENSFCYWLEFKKIGFGIGGGNASKFGIYKPKESNQNEYATSYGKNKNYLSKVLANKFFSDLLNKILKALEFTRNDEIDKIKELNVPIWNMVLQKILVIYYPEKFLTIGQPKLLIECAKELNIRHIDLSIDNSIQVNFECKKFLSSVPEFENWSYEKIGTFVWQTFDGENNKGNKSNSQKYWLYSPGEKAFLWDEFYDNRIMGLGWDDIGDIAQYQSRDEIKDALDASYEGEGSKVNDIKANYDFLNSINIGDIIIAKKGKRELLGYGIVTSNYQFDNNRERYKKIREVDWKLKGNWIVDHDLVIKTLTDITNYETQDPNPKKYYEKLMELMTMAQKINYPLNTIFYGPPGTGKTYNTILRAAEIIENRKIDSYEEAKRIFKDNLHNQIEFITFHQNYSYEDFIQGLRPDIENSKQLTFEKKDGIFVKIATDALFEYFKITKKSKEYKQQNNKDENEVYLDFIEHLKNLPSKDFKSSTGSVINITSFSKNDNIEFKHANSSRTYLVSANRLIKLFKIYPDINKINNVHKDIVEAIGGCNSTVYWVALREFIEFYNNYQVSTETENEEVFEEITYESKRKLLTTTNLDDLKVNDAENVKNYVIIIDEINRANISRVFGELITLIESDKRSHGNIPMEAKLPSGDSFVVPSNLYIIGTMNTADKSIALLDIALRRRFEFEPMYPKYKIEGKEIHHVEILQKINEQIIQTKGHDFQIGHSYFMEENDLAKIMNYKVIPLLLEYYMNDKDEVKLILQSAGMKIDDKVWPLRIIV